MVRDDGRDSNGYQCWKTQNKDGQKLMKSNYNTKITIFWDNRSYFKAWLKDEKTIHVDKGDH